ncbi:Secreted protein [Pseudomonas donghuensis]
MVRRTMAVQPHQAQARTLGAWESGRVSLCRLLPAVLIWGLASAECVACEVFTNNHECKYIP